MTTAKFAAIDCGSNSLRMITLGETGVVLDRQLVTTRLGRSIPSTGAIDDEARVALVGALQRFAVALSGTQVAAVATSAVRDATNGALVLAEAGAALGAPLEVIDGQEEGRLTFLGATAGRSADVHVVIDVGGGSTEVAVGAPGLRPTVTSVQAGCVRLTHGLLSSGDFSDAVMTRAASVIAAQFELVPLIGAEATAIAVGGTATTLAGYDRQITNYQPGSVEGHHLSVERIDAIAAELAGMSSSEREHHRWLPSDRGDVTVAGATILAGALRRLGRPGCLVSERGILEGVVIDRFDVMIGTNAFWEGNSPVKIVADS